ncbi:hypothetical protein F2Q70_00023586 [Brassica cretica]|uniref:Uncharacterized protein n=1 Tax=Brassica cretica TaxID=69181 RepID=A0A8S9GQA9_BRACR|nr:hypothetical protein F2Q70_00023586 [Brassica cretica]
MMHDSSSGDDDSSFGDDDSSSSYDDSSSGGSISSPCDCVSPCLFRTRTLEDVIISINFTSLLESIRTSSSPSKEINEANLLGDVLMRGAEAKELLVSLATTTMLPLEEFQKA